MDIFNYHSDCRKGKIEILPSKRLNTVKDLSVAYTPGVGKVSEEIHENPEKVYEYTSIGNLIAIITNGTAVLGLGDIGNKAAKPVMEGKSVLFKLFADVDAIDIEVEDKEPESFVRTVKSIAVTFGGINLEDIKAPECFQIEESLKNQLDIPVMHDDQWGTATVILAGLWNALYLVNKKISDVKIVINGAGSSALATAQLLKKAGAKNIYVLDSKGLISNYRTDLNPYKQKVAVDEPVKQLDEVIKGADVFIGLSVGNILKEENLKNMSEHPIIFALANPIPEIYPDLALKIRKDGILATGRSDFHNQINNLISFPYIFRAALDTRAKINMDMLISASKAISEIAKLPVPDYITQIYGEKFEFGKEYIIPKPFDRRLLLNVPVEIAKTAIEARTAKINIELQTYPKELEKRLERIEKINPICSL